MENENYVLDHLILCFLLFHSSAVTLIMLNLMFNASNYMLQKKKDVIYSFRCFLQLTLTLHLFLNSRSSSSWTACSRCQFPWLFLFSRFAFLIFPLLITYLPVNYKQYLIPRG